MVVEEGGNMIFGKDDDDYETRTGEEGKDMKEEESRANKMEEERHSPEPGI